MTLLESVERIVRALVGRRIDYLALYPATVVSQGADYALELLPDDARVRGTGLAGVPIRWGLAGARCKVGPGARVLLGFAAGDPSMPYATLWEHGDVDEVGLGAAHAPVVRVGDTITGTVTAGGPGTVVITSVARADFAPATRVKA